ncbi:MAG: hypothetical protein GXX03_06680 [Bacteroidales bacterium]|nr:hypothetical protein [Bacteroidales bacterium]
MTATKQFEKLLNKAQKITGNYLDTLNLTELQPDDILAMQDEKLKKIAAMIYLCNESLRFTSHEITYNAGGFEVDIINQITPF